MKTCFHSHFYANFQEFYEGQLKQQICNSFLLLILIYLKLQSSSFRLYQFFPILMVQMLFSQIQQAPGPDFRLVGKSPIYTGSGGQGFKLFSCACAIRERSCRLLDSRSRDYGFESHRRHYVVSLSKTH